MTSPVSRYRLEFIAVFAGRRRLDRGRFRNLSEVFEVGLQDIER